MTNNTQLMGPLGVNETPSDYFISGTIASGLIGGSLNYKKYKDNKISKEDAIKNTIKTSSQAGIAAGASIATVQYLSNKNYLGATLSLIAGAGCILAIEKYSK